MHIMLTMIRPLQWFNDLAGRIGRGVAVAAIGLMVAVILLQVFFRYVLNNALPWPDEAARFFMLWLTGMMGPIAFRRGGMVAITTLHDFLPARFLQFFLFLLLLISLAVLVVAINLGWKHVGSGWLFASSSLRLPLEWIGMKTVKLKLAWMYMSLFTGFCLMFVVNVELLLRMVVMFFGGGARLAPLETEMRSD